MTNNMNGIYEASMSPEYQEQVLKIYGNIRKSGNLNFTEQTVADLIRGAYDMHVHAGPDDFGKRLVTEADVAKDACDNGMGGVVFKLQGAIGSCRETFVQEIADRYADENGKERIRVFSGVVLNKNVGGINPYAVEASLKMGGKYVWTPSRDSAHQKRVEKQDPAAGIEVVTPGGGDLIPELYEIFKMIAEKDAILGISHQSTRERLMMVKAAKDAGVRRIVIEHPELNVTRLTLEQMRMFADMGVYLDLCFVSCVPNFLNPYVNPQDIYDIITTVGTDHIVLGTDLTQVQTNDPVTGFRMFIKILLSIGIGEEDIRTMCVANPRQVLL